MTQIHRTRSFAAIAAAAALALTACGGGDDSSSGTSSGGGQGSASSEKGGAAAGETVTAKKSRVSFDVPKGWESVDVSDTKSAQNPPKWLKDAAKQQKVSPKEILQAWSQSGMEVVVAGDSKLSKSISVANLPKMPTESQLKSQLKQGGAKASAPKDIKTSAGKGFSVSSSDKQTSQELLIVPADKGAAVIQVVAPDKKTAGEVSKTVTDSIDKA